MTYTHAHSGSNQWLLSNVLLEETIWEGFSELFRVCRVANFAVHGHNQGISSAKSFQSIAVSLTGSYRICSGVARKIERLGGLQLDLLTEGGVLHRIH